MKETIQSLIEQGNKYFLAGRQTNAMLYYLDAMKKSGALKRKSKGCGELPKKIKM
jgi:hypothetical protein